MLTRRGFLSASSATTAIRDRSGLAGEIPALLGGGKAHPGPFPRWPMYDRREEQALRETLGSRRWLRVAGENVNRFEQAWARTIGTKGCVATANGTSALILSLKALGVGPGDEVIVPPYTFIATVNAVLMLYALPVFVDTDRETAQIDARKIADAITPRTAAILPVHLGGSPADLDAILSLAARRRLPVVEDACQAHLAEWRGRRVGSLGTTGCFSFQATKNQACGEGGAVMANDEALLEKGFALHSHGRPRHVSGYNFIYKSAGANLRMDEFHAAMASAQLTRIEEQARTRDGNAAYLTQLLREIPGIVPARMYPGCTRNAWHLYIFRYQPEAFAGLPKRAFLRALSAEGVSCAAGYTPLTRAPFLEETFAQRTFRSIFSPRRLAGWRGRNRCPENDRLCEEAVWLTHNMFLGTRTDMEQIADAVRKIQAHADRLRAL
jgi:dTDP-4-amino-4,6-dideoxygalactose transaminase